METAEVSGEREEDRWVEVFYHIIAAQVPPAAATEKDISPIYLIKAAVGFVGKIWSVSIPWLYIARGSG